MTESKQPSPPVGGGIKLLAEVLKDGLADAPVHPRHFGYINAVELAVVPDVKHGPVVMPSFRMLDGSVFPLRWIDALFIHDYLAPLFEFAPKELRDAAGL